MSTYYCSIQAQNISNLSFDYLFKNLLYKSLKIIHWNQNSTKTWSLKENILKIWTKREIENYDLMYN